MSVMAIGISTRKGQLKETVILVVDSGSHVRRVTLR